MANDLAVTTVLAVAFVLWVGLSGFLMGRRLRGLEWTMIDTLGVGAWLVFGGFIIGAGTIRDILT